MSTNKVNVVLGSQWGDEGKGKLVDILASEADVVARCAVSFQEIKKKKFFFFDLKKKQYERGKNKLE